MGCIGNNGYGVGTLHNSGDGSSVTVVASMPTPVVISSTGSNGVVVLSTSTPAVSFSTGTSKAAAAVYTKAPILAVGGAALAFALL